MKFEPGFIVMHQLTEEEAARIGCPVQLVKLHGVDETDKKQHASSVWTLEGEQLCGLFTPDEVKE